jgi:aminoglycoside phosphotransferase (APT) family kinase protein
VVVDASLATRLIATQFPDWAKLPVTAVPQGGWDNRSFRVGEEMLARFPSAACYAPQVENESRWLPVLAPSLPLAIPVPLVLGEPDLGYPFAWSVYRWIEGETLAACAAHPEPSALANLGACDDVDFVTIAKDLAQFLIALQRIEATGGPVAGAQNFYRGGDLATYSDETYAAIGALADRIDHAAATRVWDTAVKTAWPHSPVWVHGDISMGNLLLRDGRLCAVIDFGQLAVGDPACDLAIAWSTFDIETRAIFRAAMPLDDATWSRGRAWALWKALIVAAGHASTNPVEAERCWRVLRAVLSDVETARC